MDARGPTTTMNDDRTAGASLDWSRPDEVTVRALDLVVDANGDLDLWFATGTSALEGRPSALSRFARRAGFELHDDRSKAAGMVAVPADQAIEICRRFSRREPQTVLTHLLDTEHRIRQGEVPPGGVEVSRDARATVRAWTEGDGR